MPSNRSILARLVPLALAFLFATTAQAQNIAPQLVGTWSTGNGAVLTGPTFANAVNKSFSYPPVAGLSFSFTDTGFFEQSQFSWISDAKNPHCVKAVISWLHGRYNVNTNGSITTTSNDFAADGMIQTQDACSSTTSSLFTYNQPLLYQSYVTKPWRGKTMLQLQAFDGAPLARLYLVSRNATRFMNPTSQLFQR